MRNLRIFPPQLMTFDTRKFRGHTLVCVMTRVKTECDLELLSFIPVAAVALCLLPNSSHP